MFEQNAFNEDEIELHRYTHVWLKRAPPTR